MSSNRINGDDYLTWRDHVKAALWPLRDLPTLWRMARMQYPFADDRLGLLTAYNMRRIGWLCLRSIEIEVAMEKEADHAS
jgi:hypothetical protein